VEEIPLKGTTGNVPRRTGSSSCELQPPPLCNVLALCKTLQKDAKESVQREAVSSFRGQFPAAFDSHAHRGGGETEMV
jgi:hypothetical protein